MDQHEENRDPFRDGILIPVTRTKKMVAIAKHNNIKKENSKKFMKSCFGQDVFSQETKKRKPLATIGNRTKSKKGSGPPVVANYWMI